MIAPETLTVTPPGLFDNFRERKTVHQRLRLLLSWMVLPLRLARRLIRKL